VLKSPPIANLQNVISHPKRPTVQRLNDNDEMKKGNHSQNQKSCKADTQANAICSTFAFAQPHQNLSL
jgi:hypothetical protein